MIYLDVAATTKPTRAAIDEFNRISTDCWLNPSSRLYSTAAAQNLERAREDIANVLGVSPTTIVFTSGSTETANWIIRRSVGEGDHIITTHLEHPCVYNTVLETNCNIHFLDNDENGQIDLLTLYNLLEYCKRTGGRVLVAIMGANNEIGTIYPTRLIGEMVHSYPKARYFCDATQLWAHGEIDIEGVDFACASAHKFGGFKGSGFLYVKDGVDLPPLIYGGHQEHDMRAGTENLAGICAMSLAFKESAKRRPQSLIRALSIRGHAMNLFSGSYRVNGGIDVLPNILSVTMPSGDASKVIAALSLDEIYLSAGSACSLGLPEPSRILMSLGLSEMEARRTIRISFDDTITAEDIDTVFKKIENYREMLDD